MVTGSSHAERLAVLKEKYPNLSWQEDEGVESEELLCLVWQQLYDYTIADSNELVINRRYYPELHPAFAISKPKSLAWAFARSDDDSLYNAAVAFFDKISKDGTLDQLIDRYYGHIGEFDYVGTRRYQAHIDQRLPAYRELFQLAADGSHGLAAARRHRLPGIALGSGRGFTYRGTRSDDADTGRGQGPEYRRPHGSGTEHPGWHRVSAAHAAEIFPIASRNRTGPGLALAAYNIGLGHLEDARILTLQNGGDPDKWVDVKKNLPLLSKEKWFQKPATVTRAAANRCVTWRTCAATTTSWYG